MRITLDTNQLVRALMRPPQLATFVMAWEARRFVVVGSSILLEEYERVLSYPEVVRLIYPELLRAFRTHLIHDIELVYVPEIAPICRDPDDDKVIATAVFGLVEYLLTEDNDLRTPAVIAALRNADITVISMNELIRLVSVG
jgi:putative PIN family toxin of toxin-antitoxin system